MWTGDLKTAAPATRRAVVPTAARGHRESASSPSHASAIRGTRLIPSTAIDERARVGRGQRTPERSLRSPEWASDLTTRQVQAVRVGPCNTSGSRPTSSVSLIWRAWSSRQTGRSYSHPFRSARRFAKGFAYWPTRPSTRVRRPEREATDCVRTSQLLPPGSLW
jgi:hypothetical protein